MRDLRTPPPAKRHPPPATFAHGTLSRELNPRAENGKPLRSDWSRGKGAARPRAKRRHLQSQLPGVQAYLDRARGRRWQADSTIFLVSRYRPPRCIWWVSCVALGYRIASLKFEQSCRPHQLASPCLQETTTAVVGTPVVKQSTVLCSKRILRVEPTSCMVEVPTSYACMSARGIYASTSTTIHVADVCMYRSWAY